MRRENRYIVSVLVFISIIAGLGFYVFKSSKFEREAPKVFLVSPVYWNFKTPLRVVIADNIGIKSCKIKIEEPTREMVIYDTNFDSPQKTLDLNLSYPKNGFVPTSEKAVITITAKDGSWWNFFSGNKVVVSSKIVADNKSPQVEVIANSFSIVKGGSALVIFEARDENLEKVFVKTSDNAVFNAQPFAKPGFYASLIAWDIKSDGFLAEVTAVDKAKNITKVPLRIATKNMVYKDSKLELKDDFLDGKILELAASMPNLNVAKKVDRFVYVNQTMRSQNEKFVEKLTNRVGQDTISSYFPEPFLPISKASVVGTYGDHRNFFYENTKVSESYHMGIDFASTKEAPIYAPNNGVVVYTGNNGIYGNLMVIYHNLGLFTIYGHCSSFVAKEGQVVNRGDVIAKTGTTGLALGDHLHYGILVQGVDVRPMEWLDKKWVDLNIIKVMDTANKAIATKK